MDQVLATRPVWCGTVFAVKRIINNEQFYVLQGVGLTGNIVNEATFPTLEAVLEAFNKTKSRYKNG